MGIEKGCDKLIVSASHAATMKIFKKLDYEIINEMHFNKVKIDGKSPFDLSLVGGNQITYTMVKKL